MKPLERITSVITITLAVFSRHTQPTPVPTCRCQPGESCWPTFEQLHHDLRPLLSSSDILLHNISPPASVCHSDSFHALACQSVSQQWQSPFWRSTQASAMQDPVFESVGAYYTNITATLQCDASENGERLSDPCLQGVVPRFGVAVQNSIDVENSLNFAHKHNLGISVKSTGHDFMGRSTGVKNSMLIWTHKMKNIEKIENFLPAGCVLPNDEQKQSKAIRLGGGVQWQEAYDALKPIKRVMVGGISSNGTVGATGGWLAGGGHSFISPTYGLGVDNVLQMSITIPNNGDAKSLVASACQNEDLFWAVRGGGGGSFGIVTEVVYRTYNDQPGLSANFSVAALSQQQFDCVLHEYLLRIADIADAHWGGVTLITGPRFVPDQQGIFSFSLFRANVASEEEEKIRKEMQQMFDALSHCVLTTQNTSVANGNVGKSPSYSVFLEGATSSKAVHSEKQTRSQSPSEGQHKKPTTASVGFGASRLLPRTSLEDIGLRTQLVNLIGNAASAEILNVCGGKVAKFSADSAAITPAWRNASIHALIFPNEEDAKTASNLYALNKQLTSVGGLDGAGAYLNEASYYDKSWPGQIDGGGGEWQRERLGQWRSWW